MNTNTQLENARMSNPLAYLRLGDKVEDRSLNTGTGYVAYLRGNEIAVRFDDGSEEVVAAELFMPYDTRHWII